MSHYTVNPGDTIQLGTAAPAAPTPQDVWMFLSQRGWTEYGGNDDRWKHEAKGRNSLTWEQAVACEFYEFITLGGR